MLWLYTHCSTTGHWCQQQPSHAEGFDMSSSLSWFKPRRQEVRLANSPKRYTDLREQPRSLDCCYSACLQLWSEENTLNTVITLCAYMLHNYLLVKFEESFSWQKSGQIISNRSHPSSSRCCLRTPDVRREDTGSTTEDPDARHIPSPTSPCRQPDLQLKLLVRCERCNLSGEASCPRCTQLRVDRNGVALRESPCDTCPPATNCPNP